jgi:hypothetical protein
VSHIDHFSQLLLEFRSSRVTFVQQTLFPYCKSFSKAETVGRFLCMIFEKYGAKMEELGFLTIQEISEQLNIPTYSTRYFLLVFGIKPITFVGHTGVYAVDILERLRNELSKRGRLESVGEIVSG